MSMRRRFLEDTNFKELLNLIIQGSPEVAECCMQDRRNLAGFFEELALMMNSGLLRPKVVYLMFGHYALLIDQCDAFWMGLERESKYWIVFRGFIQEMERVGRQVERSDKPITI
ncbi:MAG: hypothetical protein K8R88_05035 [Armatimonadetes bacterium]|nr:hypothetical protein [Armatimonadota bacterium]